METNSIKEKNIYISSGTGNHFGSVSKYERFNGSYFEKKECDENNFINKAIINFIKYVPDSTYCHTDGYSGTCWCAQIIGDTDNNKDEYPIMNYHFRNFENFVEFYENKGYKFVDITKS